MRQLFRRVVALAEGRPWLPLAAILILGLGVRAFLLTGPGFQPDLEQHQQWAICALEGGWLSMYTCQTATVTHPPFSVSLLVGSAWIMRALGGALRPFQDNPALILALKLPGLLFELALISLVYGIVKRRSGVIWAAVVAALLNFTLGFLVVTAWWGQTDSIYTFFLVLTFYWLLAGGPRRAWLAYALAWLSKFQSVVYLPVLLALTWRRHGLRALMMSGVGFALVLAAGLLPFVIGSGASALHPFGGPIDMFPYITNGAYNLWFWLTGSSPTVLLDRPELVAGLSYFQVGLILLVVGTAVMGLRAWLLPDRDDAFLLAAAMNMTFYMLPTQVQARYLYPGLVFLALAMAGSWRLVALYIGIAVAFSYNINDIVWLGHGIVFYPDRLMFWQPVHDALAMTLFAVLLLGITLRPLGEVRGEFRARLLRPAR